MDDIENMLKYLDPDKKEKAVIFLCWLETASDEEIIQLNIFLGRLKDD